MIDGFLSTVKSHKYRVLFGSFDSVPGHLVTFKFILYSTYIHEVRSIDQL